MTDTVFQDAEGISFQVFNEKNVYSDITEDSKNEQAGDIFINFEGEKTKVEENSNEVNVFDVAAYILQHEGEMSTMKLQKLVYYCQAWSLVWDEKPLFNERIEAWANGPVVKELFNYHRGTFQISSIEIGNPDCLDDNQKDTVNHVLKTYADKTAQWLIELTHLEMPWIEARKGLGLNERGNREISLDTMANYFSSL